MSSVYNTEPATSGKVVLQTTVGELEIELWSKECPKTTRNFIQLCMEGYYNNNIFHRIENDFIAQTGDPTGTGEGGESIYGAPFADEFHSRLQFNRRGLIGSASFEPNKNGSQFFLTLGSTPALTRRNTLFGKIVGNTLFNLLKLNDVPVDGDSKPYDTFQIFSADVVWNPFNDIIPREIKVQEKEITSPVIQAPVSNARAIRNRNLLSFGDEVEEDAFTFGGGSALKPDVRKTKTKKPTGKTPSAPAETSPNDSEDDIDAPEEDNGRKEKWREVMAQSRKQTGTELPTKRRKLEEDSDDEKAAKVESVPKKLSATLFKKTTEKQRKKLMDRLATEKPITL